MRRMQSRKNRIANEPEAIKSFPARCILYVSLDQSYTPSDFFDSENEAQDSAQEFRTAERYHFHTSPPNKSFCTEPRQTSPAEQPKRPAKIAPGKIGQPKAPHQTQSKIIPLLLPRYLTGSTVPAQDGERSAPSPSICFPRCSLLVYAAMGKAFVRKTKAPKNLIFRKNKQQCTAFDRYFTTGRKNFIADPQRTIWVHFIILQRIFHTAQTNALCSPTIREN